MLGAYSAPARAVDARRALRLFPVLAERRAPAGDVALRRPAADGGDRPRADGQSRACCCATRSASALRRSSSATSTRVLPRSAPRAPRCSSSSRTSTRRWPRPTASTASRKGRVTLRGPAGRAHARRDRQAYFGILSAGPDERCSARRAGRRALRALRRRAVVDVRRDAAGQHRARRPDRAREPTSPLPWSARPACIRSCRWSSSCRRWRRSVMRCSACCSIARSGRTSCHRFWSLSAFRSSSRTACCKASPPTVASCRRDAIETLAIDSAGRALGRLCCRSLMFSSRWLSLPACSCYFTRPNWVEPSAPSLTIARRRELMGIDTGKAVRFRDGAGARRLRYRRRAAGDARQLRSGDRLCPPAVRF